MRESLLGAAEQAIVVVDRAGTVQLTNSRAENLLCRTADLLGEQLETLGAGKADKRLLRSADPVSQSRLTLRAGEGTRATLATQRPINDDYEHRLWLFTDLREIDWQADGRYLEQTVNEVAQSARLPLLLAGSLLRGAAKALEQPAVAGMLDTAIRQLGKADITYERLANTLAVRQVPNQPRQVFDAIELLRHTIRALPEEDERYCQVKGLTGPDAPKLFKVSGWPDQLRFAFRSTLDYMLLNRRPDTKLRVALRVVTQPDAPDTLRIVLSALTDRAREWLDRPSAPDPISAAERRARELAELAPETIKLAVVRHGGSFSMSARTRGTLAFTMSLPASGLGFGARES